MTSKWITSVDFDEATHTYAVDGEIAKLSVTELLAKHKLAPNYSGANTKLLQDSAVYGRDVHKDLENIANSNSYIPQTKEGESFKKWLDNSGYVAMAEKVMGFIYGNLVIGGTADLILIDKDGKIVAVADHKTTSVVHNKAVTWQVNILDYMAQYNIAGYTRAKEFKCFHYSKDGTMEIVELSKIPDEEIEKLFEKELNDELYEEPKLELDDTELALKAEQAEQYLYIKEQEYKKAKAEAEQFREKLCKCFEEQRIKSWESPNKTIKITYVEPTTSKTVDSTKLKTEYPDIYEKCLKETTKKGYIKVTTKMEA